MKKPKSIFSRRSFLKKSTVASSFFIVPRFVLGGKGYTSPSDKLSIASIGCGGKGSSDIINTVATGKFVSGHIDRGRARCTWRKGSGINRTASSSKITDRTACDRDVACGKVSGCLT